LTETEASTLPSAEVTDVEVSDIEEGSKEKKKKKGKGKGKSKTKGPKGKTKQQDGK